MIEAFEGLMTTPSVPSWHVLVVHFPIALICLAPVFDLACLLFRSRVWLDRAAAAFYVMGTIGAGAAYLTGQRAAKTVGDLTPAAESAMADHEALAVLTLVALSVAALYRCLVSWLARHDQRINVGIFRLTALPVALLSLALVVATADRGGHLVYQHGVGVSVEKNP
jgi:uncharacterized membrane protein